MADESTFQVREIPTPDADAIRADVLVYNRRTKDAQALLDSTLRDDPKNALAHETMGYLKFREGDIPAARKWYGEAVQLDSQSYLAHYYYATMSMNAVSDGQDPEIESSLRTCIKLNPAFAPAYDALGMRYSRDAAKAGEAHMLNVQAINLEPDNLNYRLNAASVLVNTRQYDSAVHVLQAAIHVAKTPDETALVQNRIEEIAQYQASVAQNRQAESEAAAPTVTSTIIDTRTMTITGNDGSKFVVKASATQGGPKYPTEAPTGPHHTARGVLANVKCSYPTVVTLSVNPGGSAPAISLYRNDFSQIEFTATNFTPKGNINPCTDMEGLRPRSNMPKSRTNPLPARSSLSN